MLHFGLLGSSLVNLLYTAAVVFMAANLLWLSPWLEEGAQHEVRAAPSTIEHPLMDTPALTNYPLHASQSNAQANTEAHTSSSTAMSSQVRETPPVAHKRENAPRRSFSFHYLDILEWLFASKPDSSNVPQPRPATGNLSH